MMHDKTSKDRGRRAADRAATAPTPIFVSLPLRRSRFLHVSFQ